MKRILLFSKLNVLLLMLPAIVSASPSVDEAPCMDCLTAPLLFCPSTYFGCTTDNLDPLLTGFPVALPGDMNCPSPIVSYTDTLITDTPCLKKYHRIWQASYPPGEADAKLRSQCIQTIFLEDLEAPVIQNCPSDITIDLVAQCDSTAVWTVPSASDDCGGVSLTSNYQPGDTFPSGTTVVSYLAVDACGRTDSCSFQVIVAGVCCENLEIACPSDTTVCVASDLDPLMTGFPQIVMPDSSCTNPVINYIDTTLMSNPSCAAGLVIERLWFASDSAQNIIYSSCIQIITTGDTIAPVITDMPGDTTLTGLGQDCMVAVNWPVPSVSDSCGILAFSSNIPNGSLFPEGTSTVNYAAVDLCGNTAVATFDITIECDTSCIHDPVITCPSDITLCPMDSIPLPGLTGMATAVPGDSTCLQPLISYTDSILSSGPCPGQITLARTWVATDPDNTNLADSCIQTITLQDNNPPIISGIPSDITIQSEGAGCLVVASWILPMATDNCGLQSFESNIPSGSLLSEGITTVVYTAIDNCGLIATASFTVTVECIDACSQLPVINCPPDYWTCPGSGIPQPSVSGYATAIAGGPDCQQPLISYEDLIVSSGPCPSSKIIERKWKAVDPDNNALVSTCIQTLNLEDWQPPQILYCPSDITVSGSTAGCTVPVSWNAPLATDNCGAPQLVSQDSYGNPVNNGQLFGAGTTTVVYTATDDCGNTTQCSFTVTVNCSVQCNTPPVISCPANKTVCPGSSISPSVLGWANAYGSSSCPSPSVSYQDIILSTGPCYGEKSISRTWTAVYGSGYNLSSSCVQHISLKDNQNPYFTYCPDDITVYDSNVPVYWSVPQATDNCGIANLVQSHSPGSYFPQGTTTVSYTAEDICWNASTCSFTVTVQNQYNINVVCPDDLYLTCNSGNGVLADWNTPVFSSACNACDEGQYIPGFVYMGSLNGSQYYCSTSTASWPQAKADCEANGGHLVHINSSQENQFLKNLLTLQSAWIGLSDANSEGWFKWTDGEAPVYTNWYPGQPNNYNNNQDYVELMNDGYWNDQYNYYSLEYIMEIPCSSIQQVSGPSPGSYLSGGNYTVAYEVSDGCGGFGSCSFNIYVDGSLNITCPADITLSADAGGPGVQASWNAPQASSCCSTCDDQIQGYPGFVYMGTLNGHKYYCSTYNTSWPQAKADCEQYGGYLAVIGSVEENNLLSSLLTQQSAWIGLSDINTEGNFEWVNNEPLGYTNWYPGQPNDYNSNQDYVELLSNGQWNDQYNYYSLEFIMELPDCIDIQQIGGPQQGSYLAPGSNHTVSYRATDACGNSSTCSFDITVESVNNNKTYCNSYGINSIDYHITHVRFAQIDNASGDDGGYGDYTTLDCADLKSGNAYQLYLEGTDHHHDRLYWRVWIDLNIDGDFEDQGELVAYGSGLGMVSGVLTIPSNTAYGKTRMRIAASPVTYPPSPCGPYNNGETEDYCVELINVDTSNLLGDDDIEYRTTADHFSPLILSDEKLTSIELSIYPNPASDRCIIELNGGHNAQQVQINDVNGRVYRTWKGSSLNNRLEIDLGNIPAGVYFVRATGPGNAQMIKKLIVSK